MKKILFLLLSIFSLCEFLYILSYVHKEDLKNKTTSSGTATTTVTVVSDVVSSAVSNADEPKGDTVVATTTECSISKVMSVKQYSAVLHNGLVQDEKLLSQVNSVVGEHLNDGRNISEIKKDISKSTLKLEEYKKCVSAYDTLAAEENATQEFSEASCLLAMKCSKSFQELVPIVSSLVQQIKNSLTPEEKDLAKFLPSL